MILGGTGFITKLARDARVAFMQPVDVLPQMRVSAVEFIAKIAVEDLVLATTMRAELFESYKTALVAFGTSQGFVRAFRVLIDFNVIARIEHF